MEYKKIENLVYKNNLIKRENFKTKKEYEPYTIISKQRGRQ